MSHQELLEERLVDWNIERQQGREVSAGELCKDHPELIPELEILIAELKQMDWLDVEDDSVDDFLQLPDESISGRFVKTQLQDYSVSLETFRKRVNESGVVEHRLVEDILSNHKPGSGEALAKLLVQDSLLTEFQAEVLLENRALPLILDRYLILDEIGAGGMGIVYKALHQKMDRIVALKILPQSAVDTAAKVKRFQREVEAVARLEHRNIVTAHDAHTSRGIHYLVMAYVEGKDLAAVVRESGPLSITQAIDCVQQVAKGLAHAHEMGIVHRDIKPGNLLMDQNGLVQVLDLGLARIDDLGLKTNKEDAAELTHTGMVMGTIAYLAPEQALDTRNADARSDIYSLGCTLYYLLTGQPPYSRETVMKTILAHREEKIPSLRDRHANATLELDTVFQKMVAKTPEDRFQSMDEVIDALETLEFPDEAVASSCLASVSSTAIHDTDNFHETSIEIVVDEPRTYASRKAPKAKKSIYAWLIAAIVLGLVLMGGLMIQLQTAAGTLVLEMSQSDLAGAVVTIDGEDSITIKTGEGNEKIRIQPDAEKHLLEITHPNFEKFVKKFEFATANEQTIKVWLEPKGFDLAAAGENFQVKNPDRSAMNNNQKGENFIADDGVETVEEVVIASGEGNFALQFDGVDDYVDLGDDFRFNPNEPLTIEAWVRIDGNTERSTQAIVASQPFQLGIHDNKNKWQISVRDRLFGGGIQAHAWTAHGSVKLGQPHHIASVWQGNKSGNLLKLFVNGKLTRFHELSAPLVFHDKSGMMQYLGMEYLYRSSPYGVLNGVMDEVRISKVVRYEHDFNPMPKFAVDKATLALYRFDEGEGDVAKDSSGNGHDGKIHGAKWYTSEQ